jgi:hypothetical protein
MTPRAAMTELARHVAADMGRGQASANLMTVGDTLAAFPGAALEIVTLIVAESHKKRPNAGLINAFGFMLGEVMTVLRFGVERGRTEAIAEVAAIRSRVQDVARDGTLSSTALMLVLRQFVTAKLELGDALKAAVDDAMEQHARTSSDELDPAALDSHLADLSQHCRGDVFAIQMEISEEASAFPDEFRVTMAACMMAASDPAIREAAVAWVLDPSPETRRQIAPLLLQVAQSGRVSGTMLRRLITMRNWLPDDERPAIDSIIRACRQKNIEITSLPAIEVNQVLATAVDGSGAQSLHVMVKDKRKRALAAILLKPAGIRDAFVNSGLSSAEADDLLTRVEAQTEHFESGTEHLRLALAHGLAASRDSGILPPFGLVDVLERIGLTGVQPETLSTEALVALLLEEVSEKDSSSLLGKALNASTRWDNIYVFIESWLEDEAAVDVLLTGSRRSRAQKAELVLREYLPLLRHKWAHLIAWTALTLRQDEMAGDDWLSFALVARELLGARKLEEFPIMVSIARRTVEASHGRSQARRP